MSALGPRKYSLGVRVRPVVGRLAVEDRPARLRIDTFRPGHLAELAGRDKLARGGIQNIEEAVFRRLHHHPAWFAIDVQGGDDDVLGRGEIPGIPRRGLVVPHVLAGVGIEGDDRRYEQIVSASLRAQLVVPKRAITDADIEQVESRVVGHRIPHRTTATLLPVLVAEPGLADHGNGFALIACGRVAGDRKESPGLFARFGVIGRDVAAHAKLGAAVTDNNLAVDHPRRPGNRVVALSVDQGVHGPDQFTRFRIQGLQAAVVHPYIHLVAPHGDTPVGSVTAAPPLVAPPDLGIIIPQQLAGPGIQCKYHAVGSGGVQHAVDDDGRGLDHAIQRILETPGEAQFVDGVDIDRPQR